MTGPEGAAGPAATTGAARTAIMTVDDDPGVSRAVARDLRRRYGESHRIVRAESGAAALDVKIVQLVKLLRNGEPVKMSKRSGDFVTLREVVDEVGADAVRFIMLMRKNDATLDFDLAKVIEQSDEMVGTGGAGGASIVTGAVALAVCPLSSVTVQVTVAVPVGAPAEEKVAELPVPLTEPAEAE